MKMTLFFDNPSVKVTLIWWRISKRRKYLEFSDFAFQLKEKKRSIQDVWGGKSQAVSTWNVPRVKKFCACIKRGVEERTERHRYLTNTPAHWCSCSRRAPGLQESVQRWSTTPRVQPRLPTTRHKGSTEPGWCPDGDEGAATTWITSLALFYWDSK